MLDPYAIATAASAAGNRKTPDPIMFPTTMAVAVQMPISRLSSGRVVVVGLRSMTRAIVPLLSSWERGCLSLAATVGPGFRGRRGLLVPLCAGPRHAAAALAY